MKIVVENTLYSLLLYWLIEEPKDTIYILDSMIDKKVIENIEKKYPIFVFNSHYDKSKIYRFVSTFIIQKIELYLYVKKYLNKSEIYGNDYGNNFDLFRKYPYCLLEDGTVNYTLNDQLLQKSSIRVTIRNFLRGYHKNKPFGLSKNCKKIYLTGLAPVPNKIKDKVEIVNLQKLWKKKSTKEKDEILNLLNFNISFLKHLDNKKYMLVTQPLSEDGYITEREKIDIYKSILKDYNMKDLVIKIHPREKTDYRSIFSDAYVIDKSFPVEILKLLNINFEKVITLFSTAVLDMDSEIVWFGTSVHPNLKKKFGDMDDIIKSKENL